MDATAISLAARQMRDFLALQLGIADANIFIDHPSSAYKDEDKSQHSLNLFFYRIEPGSFLSGGSNLDPIYIKMHCLITALGADDNGVVKVSAGENDLRLIGGVVASFHSQPFMMLQDDEGNDVAQLQLVMIPLSLEELNHIWSTQGDIAYRPSVAYEIGLAPVPLAVAKERSPRTASVMPSVESSLTDASANLDWLPQIKFKADDGQWVEGLTLGSDELPADVEVGYTGVAGTEVSFSWEVWDSVDGWQTLTLEPAPTANIVDTAFNEASSTITLAIPLAAAGQATLYAVRSWQRPDGSTVKLRSNPLLIVVGGSA